MGHQKINIQGNKQKMSSRSCNRIYYTSHVYLTIDWKNDVRLSDYDAEYSDEMGAHSSNIRDMVWLSNDRRAIEVEIFNESLIDILDKLPNKNTSKELTLDKVTFKSIFCDL